MMLKLAKITLEYQQVSILKLSNFDFVDLKILSNANLSRTLSMPESASMLVDKANLSVIGTWHIVFPNRKTFYGGLVSDLIF